MIIQVLQEYENQSGQKINKEKGLFQMFSKAATKSVKIVEEIIDLLKGKFPLTYLGCPIGHAKKSKTGFADLI